MIFKETLPKKNTI